MAANAATGAATDTVSNAHTSGVTSAHGECSPPKNTTTTRKATTAIVTRITR
nr:hypothetical protein [Microbispora sp. GKU 823]